MAAAGSLAMLATMRPAFSLRPATRADVPFLALMLAEAVNWAPGRMLPLEAVLREPTLARYVADWPRPGEVGVVAEDRGGPVGAAWLRSSDAADPGFGYVSDDVPEVSIAVVAHRRRQGIGRALLREVEAQARVAGIPAISLSVERANPAARLYLAEGYVVVGADDDADVMLRRLD